MKTLVCAFDPVTAAEIGYLKTYRREHGIRDLYVCCAEEGILPRWQREELLKRALQPYRHLHAVPYTEDAEIMTPVQEEDVRNGEFRRAAPGIIAILQEKGYYLEQITAKMCKPHRAQHSRGVAETAVHLAHCHGMDEMKAYRMGMLHDITKKMSDEEGRRILAVWNPGMIEKSPKIWHSYTAVVWLKQNMRLYDNEILHAVEHHTVGDGKSNWDHLLYISDKIEPGREYDSSKERRMAEVSLKDAAAYVLEESKAYILEKEGVHV